MIDRIRTARNILDEEIPGIDSSVHRPTRYVKKLQPLEETDQKKENRELEKGERASAPGLPGIKIADPMESELKIDRIKEINRQSLPQFRFSEVEDLIQRLEDKADKSRVAKLMAKTDDLENRSKQNNVVFWNIPEVLRKAPRAKG